MLIKTFENRAGSHGREMSSLTLLSDRLRQLLPAVRSSPEGCMRVQVHAGKLMGLGVSHRIQDACRGDRPARRGVLFDLPDFLVSLAALFLCRPAW